MRPNRARRAFAWNPASPTPCESGIPGPPFVIVNGIDAPSSNGIGPRRSPTAATSVADTTSSITRPCASDPDGARHAITTRNTRAPSCVAGVRECLLRLELLAVERVEVPGLALVAERRQQPFGGQLARGDLDLVEDPAEVQD